MKKNLKRLGLLTLTGMLALSQAPAAFAATKQPGSGKSELSVYNAELATQRTKLSELISESKSLTAQITAEQKNVKAKGYITKSSSEAIAKFSSDIKAKRQELTTERGSNKALRAAAKEARMSGDTDTAKDQLILLEAVQEKQIKIRSELVELLEKKLSYLESMTGKTIAADEIIAEIQTETAAEQTQTESEVTIDTNTADAGVIAEIVTSEGAAETVAEAAAETAETDAADEVVTDEAVIAAAFDDGAELEDSDY